MTKIAKNTICLWYERDAEEAARFYARTFPDSSVGAVHRAPGDFPSGKQGDVLTVEFTVMGIPCLGLNGGPAFKHNEAFSFQVATEDQAETDRYWNAIVGNGGQESECGWCKDKWGVSWQITPIALTKAIYQPRGDPEDPRSPEEQRGNPRTFPVSREPGAADHGPGLAAQRDAGGVARQSVEVRAVQAREALEAVERAACSNAAAYSSSACGAV
jgi:predicted 3-demethylubiquinone-9 3-methyltransferase (glyoxalase superfamily)